MTNYQKVLKVLTKIKDLRKIQQEKEMREQLCERLKSMEYQMYNNNKNNSNIANQNDNNRSKVIITSNKSVHATQPDGTPNILIDDFGRNVKEWKSGGGIPIKHKTANQTISELKKLGFK